MEEFVNLISNVGFPIACVAVMFWMLEKERQSHKEEMSELSKTIANNTSVMQQVLDHIKGD